MRSFGKEINPPPIILPVQCHFDTELFIENFLNNHEVALCVTDAVNDVCFVMDRFERTVIHKPYRKRQWINELREQFWNYLPPPRIKLLSIELE